MLELHSTLLPSSNSEDKYHVTELTINTGLVSEAKVCYPELEMITQLLSLRQHNNKN